MYAKDGEYSPDVFYQGDIIDNFPHYILSEGQFSLLEHREDAGYSVQRTANLPVTPERLQTVVGLKQSRMALLSQTCDIQRRNVMVAPVYNLADIIASGAVSEGNAKQIRTRSGYGYWFYLPAKQGVMEEAIIDFQFIHYFPSSYLQNVRDNRIIVMSDWGRHHLGWALTNYFFRPVKDKDA